MSTAYPGKGMPCPRSRAWRWLLGFDINNTGGVVPLGLPHVSDGSAYSEQALRVRAAQSVCQVCMEESDLTGLEEEVP